MHSVATVVYYCNRAVVVDLMTLSYTKLEHMQSYQYIYMPVVGSVNKSQVCRIENARFVVLVIHFQ